MNNANLSFKHLGSGVSVRKLTEETTPAHKMSDKENLYQGNKIWIKRRGCHNCENCKRDNCGICSPCRAMPRFGGDGKLNQICKSRQCTKMIGPFQLKIDPNQPRIDMFMVIKEKPSENKSPKGN